MCVHVAVVLAAYNGMKYLPQQLESIYSQIDVLVDVYVCVDRSTDGTEQYIQNETLMRPQLHVLPIDMRFGGAAKNFYYLLTHVCFDDYDYIALSDQDDIWESDKLIRGINELKEHGASGYSSNVMAFWEGGRVALIDKAQPQVEFDYLFEAAGPGCTYVLHVDLAREIQGFINNNYAVVSAIELHDWFIYAYARSRQYTWIIDAYPGMKYRQHGSNQVGANNSWGAARKRLALIKNRWYRSEISKIANVLNLNDLPFVKKILVPGYTSNLYVLLNVHRARRRLRDRIALSVACLLGFF